MRLLSSAREIAGAFDHALKHCEAISFAVAWASCGFGSCTRLLRAHGKIRRGVVGTHFYQTDPDFIASFRGRKTVKFILNPSGVFHPKVYVFHGRRRSWVCLIGSANFTAGGFGENSEMLVQIESSDDSSQRLGRDAVSEIDGYWNWPTAKYADAIELDRYRYWRDHFRRPLERAQGRFEAKRADKSLEETALLNMTWKDFFADVTKDQHHSLQLRIKVIDAAQKLFVRYRTLADMPLKDRQGIGGFVETEEMPWGWFGRMQGAGVFKRLINQDPKELSNALDDIPLRGAVRREDYEAFIEGYKGAFPVKNGEPHRHGLGTATRLLAMKRPDYFVCLDSANRKKLSEAFGIKIINNHDYAAYWDSIVERLCEAKWWNSRRPKSGEERDVWDGRAAFLDALYYEPN